MSNSVERPKLNSIADPAAPNKANDDHTATDGTKPQTIMEAVMDPKLMPTTDKVGPLRKVLSYGVLLSIVGGLMATAHLAGLEMFQTPTQLAMVGVFTVAVLLLAGTGSIDFWELITQYWFLSMPAVMGVVFFYALMDRSNKIVLGGLA